MAYHPGGAGLTVVDLDNADAVAWARRPFPATRIVATTRGEHWVYQGAMPSANAVRPGVDIKSRMSYARWLGAGTGAMTALPDAVRALPGGGRPRPPVPRAVTGPAGAGAGDAATARPPIWSAASPWRGQRITEARARSTRPATARSSAVLSAHGRCGCLTGTHIVRLFAAGRPRA